MLLTSLHSFETTTDPSFLSHHHASVFFFNDGFNEVRPDTRGRNTAALLCTTSTDRLMSSWADMSICPVRLISMSCDVSIRKHFSIISAALYSSQWVLGGCLATLAKYKELKPVEVAAGVLQALHFSSSFSFSVLFTQPAIHIMELSVCLRLLPLFISL